VQHTRVTRSKLASTTTEITTTTTRTALQSKVGNNNIGATRKRPALGDVTNAHKKPTLGDITNAVLKKEMEKPAAVVRRPISRKPSTVNVTKSTVGESKPLASKQATTTITESKPLASKQAGGASVLIPKKRPSEAVVAPRRTLAQSTSASSLAQKTNNNSRVAPRRRAEEAAEAEVPRKKQKVEPKQEWEDLDAVDVMDPLMVSEYVVEIFDYMRELEVSPFPRRHSNVLDQNDAKSSIHEKSSKLGMAHAWNSSRLAHRSACQIPSSSRNALSLRQPRRSIPLR
jgi:G2/mitotic-specific cyclin 2